jgi:hypothetical protein
LPAYSYSGRHQHVHSYRRPTSSCVVFGLENRPSLGAVGMWKSRRLLARFPKRGGKSGKAVFAFPRFPPRRHFHSPPASIIIIRHPSSPELAFRSLSEIWCCWRGRTGDPAVTAAGSRFGNRKQSGHQRLNF